MSYFDSEEYKQKESFFLEKIKKSIDYTNFIKNAFEDLEEEAEGTVDIFMLGIEAFNLESEEIEQEDLLDLLMNKRHYGSFLLLSRYGLSITLVFNNTLTEIFYIVNGVNGFEILRKKKN